MSAGGPGGRRSWREASFVVVDLETTGLDPGRDEIVSFAAIPVRGGRVRPGELVSLLARPRRPPAAASIRIHGLRPADLAAQRTLDEQIDLVRGALRGSILVAHYAAFEVGFLSRALARHDHFLDGPVIDTVTLARHVLGARGVACPEAPSLTFVARSLGLPVHRPHHADGDALTTAQVFIALAGLLREDGEPTLDDLARARRRGRLLGRLSARTKERLRATKDRPSLGEARPR